jgi:HlyD family secretion protein
LDIPRDPPRKRRRYIYGGIVLSVVLLLTMALSRLEHAPPSVERATLWIDSVRQGEMVRQVRGPGTLVPEQVRWVPAITAGRVERLHVRPGQTVEKATVLLELSNPDVQLEALEAQRELSAAEAELVNLRSTLQTERLNQEGSVATVRAEYQEAKRAAAAALALDKKDMLSDMEVQRAKDQAEELETRYGIEQQRLRVLTESLDSQLELQKAQVERLRAIARFHQKRVESMNVNTGANGVLNELPLELGQWVTPGEILARVAQPGRLKAELRIPETQAADVAIGQRASIDTRNGIVPGRVMRIDPSAQNGTVTVEVALEGALPRGARPDLSVDGTVEIERLEDVLYVGRPAYGQEESTVGLFRLDPDGDSATRVSVQLCKSSVNTIQVMQGLRPGDRVIISDMSQWDAHDRVRLR